MAPPHQIPHLIGTTTVRRHAIREQGDNLLASVAERFGQQFPLAWLGATLRHSQSRVPCLAAREKCEARPRCLWRARGGLCAHDRSPYDQGHYRARNRPRLSLLGSVGHRIDESKAQVSCYHGAQTDHMPGSPEPVLVTEIAPRRLLVASTSSKRPSSLKECACFVRDVSVHNCMKAYPVISRGRKSRAQVRHKVCAAMLSQTWCAIRLPCGQCF